MKNKYLTEHCTYCNEFGKTPYIIDGYHMGEKYCTKCGGLKELPNEEGRQILDLVNRFNRYPHNLL